MCGIAGIFDLEGQRQIDARALKRMAVAIAHRGPDGEGFFEAPGIGFAHRRLAIIDTDGGAQPYIASDHRCVLAYNGEIYNYKDLRHGLIDDGLRPRTNSDTEVLGEGLLRSGGAFIDQLRGMFAFAWWRPSTKSLMLARDRFGEKPLYYAVTPDKFLIFASEIGAIHAARMMPLAHDNDALSDYFLLGYVPDPKSVYEGVRKLPPGSVLEAARGGTPLVRRYWRPQFNIDPSATMESASARLLELLDDAVSSQLVSDVPLGAFLSGGIDSSSIVASMARSGDPITTCTIGFDNAAFDERPYARKMAERYSANHCETMVDIDASSLIDKIAAVYGEPFADPSALPMYEVCKAARRHVTVALSGDGGDEVLAGYRRYRFFSAEERVRRLAPTFARKAVFGLAGRAYPKLDWAPRPLRLKTTLQSLGESSTGAYARAVSVTLPDRLSAILSSEKKGGSRIHNPISYLATSPDDERLDPVSFAQKIDFETWLPGRMLTKIDRASMANGLEIRAPFLDHRLVEWALTLPPHLKSGRNSGKALLKNAQKTRIDTALLNRQKQGFSPPIAQWLRAKNGPAERLRQSNAWANSGQFSPRAVEKMISDHQRGASDCSQELWMLIMFDAFLTHEKSSRL